MLTVKEEHIYPFIPLLGHSTLLEILLYAQRKTQKRNVRKAQKKYGKRRRESMGIRVNISKVSIRLAFN